MSNHLIPALPNTRAQLAAQSPAPPASRLQTRLECQHATLVVEALFVSVVA